MRAYAPRVAQLARPACGLDARSDAELAVDRAQVRLERALGNAEHVGQLLVDLARAKALTTSSSRSVRCRKARAALASSLPAGNRTRSRAPCAARR